MSKKNEFSDIWKRVSEPASVGCCNWLGYRDDKFGYGMIRYQGTVRLVHRLVFQLWWGVTLPRWLCVLHECDNPACCNPDHLWLGTRKDNNDDRDRKGRQVAARGEHHWSRTKSESYPRGEQHTNSKITDLQAIGIMARWLQGISIKQVAQEFGVSECPIAKIVHGKSRQHLFETTENKATG